MLIGITGPAGSGKSTLAQFMVRLYEQKRTWGAEILPFAKALKDIAYSLGWDGEKDLRGRRLLQQLGTDVARGYDPDIWIKKWKLARKEVAERVDIVIVDDMRFDNEALAVREHGGKIIRLTGRGYTNIDTNHASEQPISAGLVDIEIDNSGSIEELGEFAAAWVGEKS